MPGHIDLDDLERHTYQSYFQDGLIDIGFGLMLVAFGIGIVTVFPLTAIYVALLIPVGMAAKRLMTYPRLGRVRFAEGRLEEERRKQLLFLALGILGLAAGIFMFLSASGSVPAWQAWAGQNSGALLGALLGVATIIAAALFGIPRFYAYGVIAFASFALMEQVGSLHPGWVVASGGGIITLFGIWVLARFVAENPVLGAGE